MSDDGKEEIPIIIAIIGDSFVGKSAIMMQYTTQKFEAKSTVGIEKMTKNIIKKLPNHNNKNNNNDNSDATQKCKIQIKDTAGQERYRTMTSGYYRGVDIFFLVYDITNRESFDNIDFWLKEIEKHATKITTNSINTRNQNDRDGGEVVQMKENIKVLIGNKNDLKEKRNVDFEEGKEKAEIFEVPFFEISAMQFCDVERVFDDCVDTFLNSCDFNSSSSSSSSPNSVSLISRHHNYDDNNQKHKNCQNC